MEPITREEFYLNKLTGEEQNTPEPVTREEQYLARLCGADNIIPQTPETRREAYLAALCGEEVETPEPVTRIEQYMNFAAGKSQSKPEKAITREEMYWDKYQGGAVPEEKTVQGDIIHITDATGDNAVALSVALTPTQDGTPWISDTLNTEPYLSRAAQNGNKADETVVGGTVAWNQLVVDNFTSTNAWDNTYGSLTMANNVATYTILRVGSNSQNRIQSKENIECKLNHKYLIGINVSGKAAAIYAMGYSPSVADTTFALKKIGDSAGDTPVMLFTIVSALIEATSVIRYSIGGNNKEVGDVYNFQTPTITDLTFYFGSTIADYVYSLETATTGAGVAWLKSHGFIDDSYHAYNAGELISAKPTAKTVGATTYALGGADLRGLFKLDANNNLYCDGDVYTSDGTITRNFEYRAYQSGDESLTDAITDGTNTVVKLTTPTTEASTVYTNPQKAGEAEAFVDARTEKVPVGHSTRYSAEYAINGFEGVTVHVSETQTGGTTYPVTFTAQGTVYGGTIDVVSGEMSIEYIRETNPTVWLFDSQNNVAIIKIHSYYLVDSNQPECWSNRYEYKGKTTNLASMPDKSCAIYFSYIAIRDSRFTSAEVAEEMLQGSEFVARITPTISATIDPTTIALNEGENYVWTEEGTTTLTYMAKAAQRVRSMNKALQTNLKSIELKKGGDVK